MGLTPIYPSSLGIRLGGKKRVTGVHFPCMTVTNDAANNAENQNARGILCRGIVNGPTSSVTKASKMR